MELKDISGIGEKTLAVLTKHDILTIKDLLTYFPRTYRTYRATETRSAELGDWISLVGTLSRPVSHHTTHTTTQLSTFKDNSGSLTLRWFNSPYLTRSLSPNTLYLVRGQLTIFGNTKQIVSPSVTKLNDGYELVDEMMPIYSTLGALKSGQIRKIISTALETHPRIHDPLPATTRQQYGLIDLDSAISIIHRPKDQEELELAIRRLAFDELYVLQQESINNSELNKVKTEPLKFDQTVIDHFLAGLPYTPTNGQNQVINEILHDLTEPIAMHRLLAGDVGSGKTLVAATISLAAHSSGKRVLVMAPTQILAEQLYTSLTNLLGQYLSVSLITASQKGDISADIVVGTQALLSPKYKFSHVGLVVVDEQHRFGVKQREYLASLMPAPHLLMMTATPIPRTLAMTIFANLSISRLTEMPKDRLPIKTYLVKEEKRAAAFAWIKAEIISKQNQAFVVVPLIEEAEDDEGNAKKSLKLLENELKSAFPDLSIDIMHGKMKEADKTEHLRKFRDGLTQILVATSMVEVGIDIPEANIMVIEDAERFGLSQLHQLRGRVGRGGKQGYCLLFSSTKSAKAQARLNYFAHETSGEQLASYDLENRGPGELYGESQHGFFNLRFASIADTALLTSTREAALANSLISP